jgi:hypothetical protein
VTLLELLDRALHKGVILWGDVTLSVADVDLIFVGLKVLLCSVETADRMRAIAASRLSAAGGDVPLVESATGS